MNDRICSLGVWRLHPLNLYCVILGNPAAVSNWQITLMKAHLGHAVHLWVLLQTQHAIWFQKKRFWAPSNSLVGYNFYRNCWLWRLKENCSKLKGLCIALLCGCTRCSAVKSTASSAKPTSSSRLEIWTIVSRNTTFLSAKATATAVTFSVPKPRRPLTFSWGAPGRSVSSWCSHWSAWWSSWLP